MSALIFNFHDVVLLFPILLCLSFVVFLSVTRTATRWQLSDVLLIGFLLTQAGIPMHILSYLGAGFRDVTLEVSPNLHRVFEISFWLEGPLLLWYVRSKLYKDFALFWRDALLLLPALVHLLIVTFTFYVLDHDTRYALARDFDTSVAPFATHFDGFLRESFRMGFSTFCLVEIQRTRSRLLDQYSSPANVDYGWLAAFAGIFTVIHVWDVFVSITIMLSVDLGVLIDFALMGQVGNYLASALVCALVFLILSRSDMLRGIERWPEEAPAPAGSQAGPSASRIDPQLVAALEHHMETERPYLMTILTLEQLAKQVGVAPRVLSQTINRHFDVNFFEFVNRYRVAHVRGQLELPENADRTLIDLMGESGFNSIQPHHLSQLKKSG